MLDFGRLFKRNASSHHQASDVKPEPKTPKMTVVNIPEKLNPDGLYEIFALRLASWGDEEHTYYEPHHVILVPADRRMNRGPDRLRVFLS